ncbi:MAG TPA: hypothetical protein VFG15_03280 [Amycolatopsis sp.]|nr:hypothetical protein [Amycolatopsis sp.]
MTTTSDSAVTSIRTATTAELQQGHERETYEKYRTQVRDRAIKGFHDGEWQLDRLNASLRKLGLEPFETKLVSRSALTLELGLTVETGDTSAALQAMARLQTAEGRAVLRNALADAIQTLNSNQPLPIVPSQITYASIGNIRTREI